MFSGSVSYPFRGPFSIAPIPLLSLVTLGALLVVALTLVVSLGKPWLGAGFTAADQRDAGVMVDHVHSHGPLADVLEVGDSILAISGDGERWISLVGYDPDLEPHTQPSFQAYNQYLTFQGELARIIAGGEVHLRSQDGVHQLEPRSNRPVASLGLQFWLFHLFGLMALLISTSVWVFRRQGWAPFCLFLSGLGFFIATAAHAVWITRELGLPAGQFDLLLRVNHLGLAMLLGGIISLLAFYPRPLPRMRALAGILVLLLAYQVNENLQWFDLPWHTFYLPLLFFYLCAVFLAVNQWRMASGKPVARAAMKWIFLSVFISMGVGIVVYFLPTLMGQKPGFSQVFLSGFAVTLYVGFALGVVRYRLFDLDYWWFMAWLWFLGGLSVIVLDLALVAFLGMGYVEAAGIAVLLVAWGYLPLRHWIWQVLTGRSPNTLEHHLPALAEAIVRARSNEAAEFAWQEILASLFNPLRLERTGWPVPDTRIGANGAELLVPGVTEDDGICLYHADRGGRLFSSRDRKTVQSLLTVARRLHQARVAEADGARNERSRIIRDLHDDVGGRVLALIHSATTDRQAELARRALDALRETIHALDDKDLMSLEEMVADWREQAQERGDAAGVRLDWALAIDAAAEVMLTPRYRINLRRILDEALTNALRHARPSKVVLRLEAEPRLLRGEIVNNGLPEELRDSRTLRPGRGLHNMRTRARELDGDLFHDLRQVDGECQLRVVFEIPLPEPEPVQGGPRLGGGSPAGLN